ncbi:MAG: type II toxin-antitoxin system Phd/YefM family antitoxin [Proteobacteria bacterium]|nr:type II toxin-antitoxin system Phd/YefM family antitoxin [Pseudomonadota bacterium]
MPVPKRDVTERVSKAQFKAKALEYFRRVQETGDDLVVTDHGVPVLRIVPYREQPEALLEGLRGSVLDYKDPFEPVGTEDWELQG